MQLIYFVERNITLHTQVSLVTLGLKIYVRLMSYFTPNNKTEFGTPVINMCCINTEY